MKQHFQSIRKFMALAAILSPAIVFVCFFLVVFGVGLWSLLLFAIWFILLSRLPRAEKIAGGKVKLRQPQKESMLESLLKFLPAVGVVLIAHWFMATPEVNQLWVRIADERALLSWQPITGIVLWTAAHLWLNLRKAAAVTDEEIYAYYTEMESIVAEQKAKSGS